MADMLETGSDFLLSRTQSHVSRSVTYGRTGQSDIELSATLGQWTEERANEDGFIVYARHQDFIFDATDLTYTPKIADGDTIEVVDGDDTRTYVVTSGPDGNVFRWSDPYHRSIRVHTTYSAKVSA